MAIEDFIQDESEARHEQLNYHIGEIIASAGYLTEEQQVRLANVLKRHEGDIDIHQEVHRQCLLVRALRHKMLTAQGELRQDVDIREAQQAANAFNSFLSAYMKSEEKIDRFRRLKAVEDATVQTIESLSVEQQEHFLMELERRFEELG